VGIEREFILSKPDRCLDKEGESLCFAICGKDLKGGKPPKEVKSARRKDYRGARVHSLFLCWSERGSEAGPAKGGRGGGGDAVGPIIGERAPKKEGTVIFRENEKFFVNFNNRRNGGDLGGGGRVFFWKKRCVNSKGKKLQTLWNKNGKVEENPRTSSERVGGESTKRGLQKKQHLIHLWGPGNRIFTQGGGA